MEQKCGIWCNYECVYLVLYQINKIQHILPLHCRQRLPRHQIQFNWELKCSIFLEWHPVNVF